MVGQVRIIVARARNRVIGYQNKMPWHIPEELKHFRAVTMGGIVLMGRKTFESIGKPLPGRTNLVMTRDKTWHADGVTPVHSLDQALSMAGSRQLFVAGGNELYTLTRPIADELLITEVDLAPEGDTYFADPDQTQWALTGSEANQSAKGINFRVTRWQRKA